MGGIWRMESHIESVINAYKTLSKIPSIVGGRLNNKGNRIASKWSIRNIDKGKNTQYCIDYVLDNELNVIMESDFGIDVSQELLTAVSPKENFKAIIREEKDEKEGKKKFFLEVWSKSSLTHSIDLNALDIHGDVYGDSEFGTLDWSPNEKKIVYVAEKKLKKSEPFIKRKPADGNSNSDKKIVPGMEHLFKEDWGEQLTSKIEGVIVVCDVASETFTVLNNLPEEWCPGQVRFTPDGRSVVGVAWEARPRRLGLIFCTNRPGYVFILTLDGVMKKLSAESMSVRSPRLTAGGLLWLQRPGGGPHHAALQLVALTHTQINAIQATESTSEFAEPSVIIDVVETEREISNGVFYGIYCQSLPSRCSSGGRVVFSTQQRHDIRTYVVDIETGKIVDISNNKKVPGSTTVLSVQSDVILASCSNLKTPPQLYVAKLPPAGLEGDIAWVSVSAPSPVPPSIANGKVEYMELDHNNGDAVSSFSATYFSPGGAAPHPLVSWPHGGPHSAFSDAYSLEAALFNLLGFSIVRINYRGSTGLGDANVRCLMGNIGDYETKDCLLTIETIKEQYAIEDVVLYGGSYVGSVVTHLAGSTPGNFRAMVLRNPLINLVTKISSADNPDGCAVEAGFPYSQGGPENEEHLLSLRRVSPIIHAHKVSIPVAIMLGAKDKRVPHHQGLEFARKLQANGVPCRVHMYEDNHSLSSLPVEMDNLINAADFFITSIKQKRDGEN